MTLTIREIDQRMGALEDNARESIARFELGRWNAWPALRLRLGYERLAPLPKGQPARGESAPSERSLLERADSLRGRVAFVTTSAAYRRTDDGSGVNDRLRTVIEALPPENAVVVANLRAEEAPGDAEGRLDPPLDLPTNSILPASRTSRLWAAPLGAAYALRWQRALAETGIPAVHAGRTVARILTEAKIWERLLARLRPRHVVVMVASYGQDGLLLACRRLGVSTSEYQHAVIYPEHTGYNYSASLRDLGGRFLLPDRLLLYGSFWRDALLARGFYTDEQLVVTGHPSLAPPGVGAGVVRERERRRVLVCTSMADSLRFASFVAEHLRESPHAAGLCFVIKQHPREPSEMRSAWCHAASEFPDAVELSTRDTYAEMAGCDVQLTGQSSTLYEGAHFGLFTYAIPDPAYGFQESAIWPTEGVQIVDWSYRGAFEARPLSPPQVDRAKRMWEPFDAAAFRAHVHG